MNTYIWEIESLDCVPSLDGQSDVVSVVHWRVNAVSDQTYVKTLLDGATQTLPYSSTIYGVQSLTYKLGSPFIAYSDLTKDAVIGWVQAAMGEEQVTAIQANLDKQLENLVNPSVITPPLPWSA